jgi:hypothetical protein
VSITLHGRDINTPPLQLSPLALEPDTQAKQPTHNPGVRKDIFSRGSVDTFRVKSPVAIGGLIAVTLAHDGRGAAAAWLPERVTVQHLKGSAGRVDVPCGEWLGAHWGDQKMSRMFRVPDDLDKARGPAPVCPYALHKPSLSRPELGTYCMGSFRTTAAVWHLRCCRSA